MVIRGEFSIHARTVTIGGNDPYSAFPRNNRPNPRGFNCAFGEEVGYEEGNVNYFDGDWGNTDCQGVAR